MRTIRDVLRLRLVAALRVRVLSRSLRGSPSTVGDYRRRAEVAGPGWPIPEPVEKRGAEAAAVRDAAAESHIASAAGLQRDPRRSG